MLVLAKPDRKPEMSQYGWQPIEDLPDNWQELASSGLESLASDWVDQATKLHESDALRQFNERLSREWAIETGILENLYTIDRGIPRLLIEHGIEASLIPHGITDKPAEQIVAIVKTQKDALAGVFTFVKNARSLSTSFIKELHQVLTRHQETVEAVDTLGHRFEATLRRGDWKRLPNNPTRKNGASHEYCPPEHVAAEMDRLIELHLKHLEADVPPEVEAAWLHHRFTEIHPFQDGNRRVARALASLVFLRAGWFPLVINRDMREGYIAALEKADGANQTVGDLSALVGLFSKRQENAFVKALSLSENVLQEREPLRQVISAGLERLRERTQQEYGRRIAKARMLAAQLEEQAVRKMQPTAQTLNKELQTVRQNYFASLERNSDNNSHYFRSQIIDAAREIGYFADTRIYRAWVRLKIKEEVQTKLVLSFHALGVKPLGVMAVSAFIQLRIQAKPETTGRVFRCFVQIIFFNSLTTKILKDWNNVLIPG